jgi:hypothetical protein
VLAGLAHRAINGSAADAWSFWPFLLATAVVSMLRITWALVLIPWALVAVRGTNRPLNVVMRVVALALIPVLGLSWQKLAAPYPNFLAAVFSNIVESNADRLQLIYDHVRFSFFELFSFHDCNCTLEILQRYQAAALVVLSAIVAFRPQGAWFRLRLTAALASLCALLLVVRGEVLAGAVLTLLAVWQSWRARRPLSLLAASALLTGVLYVLNTDVLALMLLGPWAFAGVRFAVTGTLLWMHRDSLIRIWRAVANLLRLHDEPRPYLFVGLNMGLLLIAVVALYDVQDWRDYRVVAPHLLLCLMVLTSGTACRWAVRFALVNLLFLPAFATQFEKSHRIRVDHERTRNVVIDLRDDLAYDPEAASPWENTLLVPEVDPSNRVRVPPGIGVCWSVPFSGGGRLTLPADSPYFVSLQQVGDDWLALPPKSRWVFATPGKVATWHGCHLKLLKTMPAGNLYLNLDSLPEAK